MGSDLKDPRAWPLQCPSNGMTRDDRKGWPLDVEQQLLGCILGEWLCSLQQQVILRIALANDGWCFCSNDVSSAELFLVPVGKKYQKSRTCSTSLA
eukprot:s5178_g2.t1